MRETPPPFRLLTRLLSGPPERAGEAIADLATSPEFAGKTGRFFNDGKEIEASADARNPELQQRLWRLSSSRVWVRRRDRVPPSSGRRSWRPVRWQNCVAPRVSVR